MNINGSILKIIINHYIPTKNESERSSVYTGDCYAFKTKDSETPIHIYNYKLYIYFVKYVAMWVPKYYVTIQK